MGSTSYSRLLLDRRNPADWPSVKRGYNVLRRYMNHEQAARLILDMAADVATDFENSGAAGEVPLKRTPNGRGEEETPTPKPSLLQRLAQRFLKVSQVKDEVEASHAGDAPISPEPDPTEPVSEVSEEEPEPEEEDQELPLVRNPS